MINNVYSIHKTIQCGIPQGPTLGPLLFLIYINDLRNCLKSSKLYLYADDKVLVESCIDIYTSYLNLQSDLDNIANWCKDNKLTINIKKSKGMIVGSQNRLKNIFLPNLTINGKELDYVNQYKYLGITLDSTLSFMNQVQNTIKIVAHKILFLKNNRNYKTELAAVEIYKTMILPYFDHGDIIYHNLSNKMLDKLQKLQIRALKICTKSRMNIPLELLYRSTNTVPLEKRRLAHVYNLCISKKLMYIN